MIQIILYALVICTLSHNDSDASASMSNGTNLTNDNSNAMTPMTNRTAVVFVSNQSDWCSKAKAVGAFLEQVGMNIPVVGHIQGVCYLGCYYVCGYEDGCIKAKKALTKATLSTACSVVTITATSLTGGTCVPILLGFGGSGLSNFGKDVLESQFHCTQTDEQRNESLFNNIKLSAESIPIWGFIQAAFYNDTESRGRANIKCAAGTICCALDGIFARCRVRNAAGKLQKQMKEGSTSMDSDELKHAMEFLKTQGWVPPKNPHESLPSPELRGQIKRIPQVFRNLRSSSFDLIKKSSSLSITIPNAMDYHLIYGINMKNIRENRLITQCLRKLGIPISLGQLGHMIEIKLTRDATKGTMKTGVRKGARLLIEQGPTTLSTLNITNQSVSNS
eukprot:297749_1